MAAITALDEMPMPDSNRHITAIFGLAIVAIVIRLLPLLQSDLTFAYIHEDSFWFIQTAQGMLHGCGFARWLNGACASAELMRTPGYPLMLMLFPNPRLTMAVQDLTSGVVCVVVGWAMWRCWGIGAAVLAECFIAFDVPSIVFSNHIMSEQLFQLMLVLAVVPPLLVVSGILKQKALTVALFSALMAAGAILVRPIGIPLALMMPVPFLFAAISRRTKLATALLAFAIPILTIFGWSTRNYVEAGYFGISTSGPINLYFFRAGQVVALENHAALPPTQVAMGERLGVSLDRSYDTDVQTPALIARMDRLSKEVLLAHPMEAVAMTLENATYITLFPMRTQLTYMLGIGGGTAGWGLSAGSPSAARFNAELGKILRSPTLMVLLAFQMLMTLAMWVGVVWALWRCRRGSGEFRVWVLYLTVVSTMLLVSAAGGEADVRFRVPVIPLLAIISAMGYLPVLTKLKPVAFSKSDNA